MATTRQGNWLGQMRVDVPDLRALESAVANDFDLLAGKIWAGQEAYIIRGFFIPVTNTAGNPASSLTLNVANGLIFHFNATEAGTLMEVDSTRSSESLNNSNSRVVGSFSSAAVNYVGIDYTRYEDSDTSDTTKFLDPNTKQETERRVPKARILDYKIIITTTPFSFNTNVCPIAIVETDSSGNVISITDARQLLFRLGGGGDSPNADSYFDWQDTDRRENAITYDPPTSDSDPFSEGDKDIFSMKQWMDAVMTVVWEAKSGESWYSPTSRDMIKLCYTNPPLEEGDNFLWDDTVGMVYWQNLKVLFENSSGGWYNTVQDPSVVISSISRTGATVTVDTATAHQLTAAGQFYLVSDDVNFLGGLKTVVSTPTSTQFTYTDAGSAVSGSGTFYAFYGAQLDDGQCLYVDLDRKTAAPTVVAEVGDLQTLPSPVIPGSRIIIAWRVGTELHVRDRAYPLGRIATETKYPNVILDPLGSGDATTFAAALALLPGYGGTIVLANNITIASSVTLPANVKLLGRSGVTVTLSGTSTELILSQYCQLMDVRVSSVKTTGVNVRVNGTNVKINLCRFNVATAGTARCLYVNANYVSANMSEFDGVVAPSTGIGIELAGGVTAFNEYDNTYLV